MTSRGAGRQPRIVSNVDCRIAALEEPAITS